MLKMFSELAHRYRLKSGYRMISVLIVHSVGCLDHSYWMIVSLVEWILIDCKMMGSRQCLSMLLLHERDIEFSEILSVCWFQYQSYDRCFIEQTANATLRVKGLWTIWSFSKSPKIVNYIIFHTPTRTYLPEATMYILCGLPLPPKHINTYLFIWQVLLIIYEHYYGMNYGPDLVSPPYVCSSVNSTLILFS